MNPVTSQFLNSPLMFILCLIPIVIVLFQAVMFLLKAWNEADKIGIETSVLKKVVVNSALFSLVPSLPIVIILAVLMPTLGKFFPWLRLSVIGSAFYENMAADMTVKAFGLSGVADTGMTPSIFISVAWVMTLGIISYPLLSIFALKGYDRKMTKMKSKGGFIEVAIPAMFLGLLAVLGVPYLVNFKNPTAITTVIVAGIFVIIMDKLAAKTGVKALKDFSFPISMVIGMASAILFSSIFAQFMS